MDGSPDSLQRVEIGRHRGRGAARGAAADRAAGERRASESEQEAENEQAVGEGAATSPLSSMSSTACSATSRAWIAGAVQYRQPSPTAPVIRVAPVKPNEERRKSRPSVSASSAPLPSRSSDPARIGPIGPARRDAKSSSHIVPLGAAATATAPQRAKLIVDWSLSSRSRPAVGASSRRVWRYPSLAPGPVAAAQSSSRRCHPDPTANVGGRGLGGVGLGGVDQLAPGAAVGLQQHGDDGSQASDRPRNKTSDPPGPRSAHRR